MTMNELLAELSTQRGSDLHLVVGQPPVFRIAGKLIRRTDGPVLDTEAMESLVFSNLTDAQRGILEQGQDVERTLNVEKNRYRFQIFHERGNLAASIRVIPNHVHTLTELGLTREEYAVLYDLVGLSRGLIVIAGPTGSGKSTTIAAMLEEINQHQAQRIITIEDPIEYEFESKESLISQRNVGEDVPGFPYGLRSAMHEDPDVLMVGETRDLETMLMTLTMAETGHLVFTTLPVNTASEAIERLITAWPDYQQPVIRRMVATNLQAVVVQQLLPRANGTGRVPVLEIMTGSQRVRQMIAGGHTDLTVAIEAGRSSGMQTLDDDIMRLVEKGTITTEVAWFRLQDKSRLNAK